MPWLIYLRSMLYPSKELSFLVVFEELWIHNYQVSSVHFWLIFKTLQRAVICLFSKAIFIPEYRGNIFSLTRIVLKYMTTILTFISLFSSLKTIFFDQNRMAYLTAFYITFIHETKNKGVFSYIMPNTPFFSHPLFTIMPNYII